MRLRSKRGDPEPPLCAAIGCAFPPVVTTHSRVICIAHGRGRRRHPAAKGAVLLRPARGLGAAANSALIWMAVLPGWFALRTAAGCWSRTKKGRAPAKSPLAADGPGRYLAGYAS